MTIIDLFLIIILFIMGGLLSFFYRQWGEALDGWRETLNLAKEINEKLKEVNQDKDKYYQALLGLSAVLDLNNAHSKKKKDS